MTIDLDRLAATVRERVPGVVIRSEQVHRYLSLVTLRIDAEVVGVYSDGSLGVGKDWLCSSAKRRLIRGIIDALDDQEREAGG